jgi:hypothetical protein
LAVTVPDPPTVIFVLAEVALEKVIEGLLVVQSENVKPLAGVALIEKVPPALYHVETGTLPPPEGLAANVT